MPTEFKAKYHAAVRPACSVGALGAGAGRISAAIDNTATRAQRGLLTVQFQTGASAPTAGSTVRFYLVRRNEANDLGAGGGALGVADAAVAAEPINAECIGSIVLAATANAVYEEFFPVYDPGPRFSIVVWNGSNQPLGAALVPPLEWMPMTDEAP